MIRTAQISYHGCIRCHKMGWTLANMGHQTHFIGQQISQAHTGVMYSSVHIFDPSADPHRFPDFRQFQNSVKILEPYVDLFHVHNEPNWLFRAVKEVTNKPIIFDIHDWTSLRRVETPQPAELEDERMALELADGFCVATNGYLKRIREITRKPSVHVMSMVPSWLFPEIRYGEHPGICYEGGVKGKNKDFRYNYEYRNWASFAQKAVENFDKERFYFYTANGGEDLSEYENPKISISEPLVYPQLLINMAHHSAGLVGSPLKLLDFEDSLPNKLFEYVAAGLPCIIVNSSEAQRFAEENGLGVGIQDASEVKQALDSLKDHRVAQDRWGYTMESQIPKLLALYNQVLAAKSPRVIAQV